MAHLTFDLIALLFLAHWVFVKLRSLLASDFASVLWECLLLEGKRMRKRLSAPEPAADSTPASLGFDWQLHASASHVAKASP